MKRFLGIFFVFVFAGFVMACGNTREEENDMKMNIQIGDNVLTATLVQNSSTEALIEMLSKGPVTIEMNDYAGMEKVGSLPESLPRNDEQINTGAGDLILYQGNSFVIYYDTNSWSLTRLGKIEDMTQQELKDILGDGSVTAVLSL
ncbi:MAG: cyclophilin-like fold protein [Ruminococcus sp.]|nr:cyclophilin-like fold protein [Ruminococcus sp.]